ncbi:MAG TPA: asparagine synthase (glutamine-hydrolyzing) [Firmicutes bacterium]|nr:asparagine synthase (glutamine-hydrolyzing) [Bacillota bacterium]
MCGFLALLKNEPLSVHEMTLMHESLQKINHRGPDDSHVYYDEHAFLGFNRLSINDLSLGGQPKISKNGDYVLLFNGEIYNYLELKKNLESVGCIFETNSEAEVLLTLYQIMGMQFVNQLRGMYAILIYHVSENTIVITRDKFGIKPLYYSYDKQILNVASELKAFNTITVNKSELDYTALQQYFTFQYIPEPNTCHTEIKLVPPGHVLKFKLNNEMEQYAMPSLTFTPQIGGADAKLKRIRETIMESVAAHMLSEVEVGTFLSGGIDSTIVTSCAKLINPNIKAFSIGFKTEGYSEVREAKKSADYLQIPFYSEMIDANDYIQALQDVIYHLDSPLADPSVVPIYLISKKAAQHVKVILSGEGADELFGGYGIYKEPKLIEHLASLPISLQKIILSISHLIPQGIKGKAFLERGCLPLIERYVGNAFVFSEKEKQQLLTFYNSDVHFKQVTQPYYDGIQHLDRVTQMQTIDLNTWLTGDILVKSDRLSMAHSLELRVPFLDVEVFECAKGLIKDEKIQNGLTKHDLREAFKDIIPPHIYQAKKKGYPVPLNTWLRHELYDFAKEILSSTDCNGLLNPTCGLKLLDEHATKKGNHARKIWSIITFILWYEQRLDCGIIA